MPILAEEKRLARLESYEENRYRDIATQVRIQETGLLGPIYGGRWDLFENRYLEPWEVRYHEISATDPEQAEAAKLKIHIDELSRKQASFAEDFLTPMIMANGSRRGGKSRGSAGKCRLHAAQYPCVAGEMISPTFPKARIMWRYCKQVIPVDWIEETLRAEMTLRLYNGVDIKFLSAYNPDSLIGEGVGWLGFDEFQNIKEQAFSLALPALSDGGSAFQAWGTGTPRMGEYRTRYERFKRLEKEGQARVLRFTFRENPYIYTGKGSIFDLAGALIDPRRRQQELEALFVSEEGLVYYRFDQQRNGRSWDEAGRELWAPDITETFCATELSCDARFVIGVDYGLGRQFAVIYKIVRVSGRLGLWAIAEVVLEKDADVEQLGNELIERGFAPAAVMDDASGPQSKGGKGSAIRLENIKDAKENHVFEVYHYASNPHVQDRVDSVNALMHHRRWFVDLDKCPRLVHCLENQEIEGGKPRRSKAGEETLHDMPDAAGYPAVYLFPADVDYEALEQKAAA
jgi:hypothetical protein